MSISAVLQDRLTLPVIAAPLFIISTPELVIAQCKAGIVGSFPTLNARPVEQLDVWIKQIKYELAEYQAANPDKKVAPFAVNQICHSSNDRLEHDMKVCVDNEVPIIITSLRAPTQLIADAHSYGGIVLHDATTIRHSEKALEDGVDGLILVCAGAGGHAGTLSPFGLLSEVRRFYNGTIALSGAIANGYSIAAAQAMGADLAYMGTFFIATAEANAELEYKQMLIDSVAEDIVYSSLFTGVPGNYLKPSVLKAGLDPKNLPSADKSTMDFSSGGNMAVKAWKDIWGAGQGTGSIETVKTIQQSVDDLRREYIKAVDELNAKSSPFL